MTQKTAKRIQGFVTAALIAIFGLVGYATKRHGVGSESQTETTSSAKAEHPLAIFSDYQAPSPDVLGTDRVLRMTPDTVLATVNGQVLTAANVFPPGCSNQNVSLEVCEYFLQRAVDRELIFQTAKTEGISLNELQQQQLANSQRVRRQQGPGLVRDLVGGPENLSFELRESEAFMLQTSLMEKLGVSPNVTSEQVSDYYQQHLSELGELPADEPSRQETLSQIDIKIRQILAFSVRSDFQRKLSDYMTRIKTDANIQLTPLASFAGTP